MENLTEEDRKLVEEFCKKRNVCNYKLKEARYDLKEVQGRIGRLEMEIRLARPTLDNCVEELTCPECDIHSMKLVDTAYSGGDRIGEYQCVICSKKEDHKY